MSLKCYTGKIESGTQENTLNKKDCSEDTKPFKKILEQAKKLNASSFVEKYEDKYDKCTEEFDSCMTLQIHGYMKSFCTCVLMYFLAVEPLQLKIGKCKDIKDTGKIQQATKQWEREVDSLKVPASMRILEQPQYLSRKLQAKDLGGKICTCTEDLCNGDYVVDEITTDVPIEVTTLPKGNVKTNYTNSSS